LVALYAFPQKKQDKKETRRPLVRPKETKQQETRQPFVLRAANRNLLCLKTLRIFTTKRNKTAII
tara:strand:- start:1251 stop:1445 length:195 start_codon:yes stop_codon:yes gene_type:complete